MRWHDKGKARRAWQRAIGNPTPERPWAKSGGRGFDRRACPGYRHEFGSLRETAQMRPLNAEITEHPERDLILHLIAAHHGWARPHFEERQWDIIGENVGSEINGKSDLFSRPAVIYKKLAHGFYFVIPTTTQQRTGSWFVPFRQRNKAMVACLHQARAIDYRRLSSKLGTLDDEDLARVKAGFRNLYK